MRQSSLYLSGHVVGEHLIRPASIALSTCRTTSTGLTFGRMSSLAISVSTGPACTPTTCVPCSRKPVRSQFVKAQAAALEALYVPALGTATQLSMDRRLTIAPPPFFARTGANARLSRLTSVYSLAAARMVSGSSHPDAPDGPHQLDALRVSCSGIDFSRPGSEQFLRKYQADSSVCACYECN